MRGRERRRGVTDSAASAYNADVECDTVATREQGAGDAMGQPTTNDAMIGSLLSAMDLAAFEHRADGRLVPMVKPPAWVSRFTTIRPGEPIDLCAGGRFEFLADFCVNASAFWAAGSGGRMKSGIWTETDASGSESHFEATALRVGERCVLLIEMLGADFYERRDLLQKARSGKLEADRIIGRETSERAQAEQRVEQLRSQLAHVGRISAMGEMAASLAHELNQPLWAMINYAQAGLNLLNAGADTERVRGAMTKAVTQAERAGGILRGLRDFIADSAPHRRTTDANRLVREVAQLLEGELRHGRVDLRLDPAPGELSVFVDPIQVQQVVFNLMRNAIEAMVENGGERRELRVTTSAGPGGVTVRVADCGPGCDAATMARLFDAFFSTKLGGMGMGLAISRTIIEAHGGTIWAGANSDGGLSVSFTLPSAAHGAPA